MKIAKINGTKVVEIVELKTFSNTSFPKSGPDADWLSANSCAEVVEFLEYNAATQKNESVAPYLSNGKVYTHRVTDMTSDERAEVVTAANAATATLNRASRDYRLANCDWVVTKAIEANSSVPTAWGAYRTALRDITTHDNWPNINKGDWPPKPD